jgi:hypothetical protein
LTADGSFHEVKQRDDEQAVYSGNPEDDSGETYSDPPFGFAEEVSPVVILSPPAADRRSEESLFVFCFDPREILRAKCALRMTALHLLSQTVLPFDARRAAHIALNGLDWWFPFVPRHFRTAHALVFSNNLTTTDRPFRHYATTFCVLLSVFT